jgi:hypothetical protein
MKLSIDSLFKNQTEICQNIYEQSSWKYVTNFLVKALIAGSIYGFIMGIYHSFAQACLSALKVPILFLVTLFICIPTLHFMGLFLGSRLKLVHSISILTYAISITCISLASFAPISLFFIVSHSPYKFIMMLHLLFYSIAGFAGLYFVRKNFNSLFILSTHDGLEAGNSHKILPIWMLLYMFVGCQMAYLLSPFVGCDKQLILFTNSEYNFFTYLMSKILH